MSTHKKKKETLTKSSAAADEFATSATSGATSATSATSSSSASATGGAAGERSFLVLVADRKYRLTTGAATCDELKKQLTTSYSLGYPFDLQYYDAEVAEYLDFTNVKDIPQDKTDLVKLLVKKIDVHDAPKLSLADIQNDRENELVIARDDFGEEEMRLFLHSSNFRRMRKAASSDAHCPVVSMVGPTGAGKSSIIKRLNPIKPPVVAFQEQQIPTTSNVNAFMSNGWGGHGPVRILDLEGDDGGLPLMEYCKNYQHLSATDYLSADDVSTFVKQVFQHYDEKELTAYMNKRKHVTKVLLPRLCYIMSDVIVYVNTVPAKRESMYLDRVLEFVEKSQTGVSSAEMPSLILVYNQCNKRHKPFDVAESTEHFFCFVDRERKLLESYRTVDFVKIPDWEHESLFATQIAALQSTIALRLREQSEIKAKNGTLFSDQVWFDILDKVVENFLQEENISMSRIFGKFIISESSLVNRAYAFFHHVYGSSTKKEFFLSAREQAIKMIAAHIVFRACEKGHGAMRDIDENWIKLFYNLLLRIRRRTPCTCMNGSTQCTEELQTHGDHHRFGGTKKRAGAHTFVDPQTDAELEECFRDTIGVFQRLAAAALPSSTSATSATKAATAATEDAMRKLHLQRLQVFQEAISKQSTTPQKQCGLCFRNRADLLLSCEHSFCTPCIRGLTPPGVNSLQCPLCGKNVNIIENVARLPGRYGVRILCLEGGGVRGPVLIKSLRRLEAVTGMAIGDMFDIVCGTGVGGVVALTVGTGKLSLDQCEEMFHNLSENVFHKAKVSHRVFGGFLQGILGKPYSHQAFTQVVQTHVNDEPLLDSTRKESGAKVFALAGATSPHFEPFIIGNYPPGKRDKPTVSCLFKVWEGCRSTMATPKFFAPFEKGGMLFVDGAVFANNPAEIAIAEANIIWNFPDIDLVVSVGTGLTTLNDADNDDNASSSSSSSSKKAKSKTKDPKGDCRFTFGQDVIDLAETGSSVHANMNQVLNENEKYVRLEPRLSNPIAASTDLKTMRQMAAEAEAWVNENDAKFIVARQRLLAKGLYVDGAGAFKAVVGESSSFEVRRKTGLRVAIDIPLAIELRNEANELVPTKVEALPGVPGARRVVYRAPTRGVYTCNVYALPPLPAAPAAAVASGGANASESRIDVSGSPFLIQAEKAGGRAPLPTSIEFVDFIKGMALSVFQGASEGENVGAHQTRLEGRLKTLGLKPTPVPLDADCQFFAVADQLFRRGAERASFIRSMVTWWLRLSGDYKLANGSSLEDLVPEGTWDSYVDSIEDGGWGDHVTLIAVSEVFGVRIVIVTSVEGDAFVTEIEPTVLKRTKVCLISHCHEFGYGSIKATSKQKLFLDDVPSAEN